jgi:hypothetical protein
MKLYPVAVFPGGGGGRPYFPQGDTGDTAKILPKDVGFDFKLGWVVQVLEVAAPAARPAFVQRAAGKDTMGGGFHNIYQLRLRPGTVTFEDAGMNPVSGSGTADKHRPPVTGKTRAPGDDAVHLYANNVPGNHLIKAIIQFA